MSALFALVRKDLTLLLRDRVALFWAMGFPLIFSVIFGSIYDVALDPSRVRLRVDVIDEGAPAAAIDGLLAAKGVTFERVDLDRARDDLRRGDAVAALRVAKDASMELTVDPSHELEASLVTARIESALMPSSPRPKITRTTIDAALTRARIVFPAAVLWGLLGCAAAFAVAHVAERASGTWLRLRASPLAVRTLVAGKFLACFFACAIDACFLVVLARAGGVRPDRPFALLASIVCAATAFAGLTTLLGSFGRSPQAVGGASWATLLLLALAGGAMVPLAVMPSWMRAVGAASPVRWGIVALEGSTWRGATLAEIASPCIALFVFGALAFVLSVAVVARRPVT